MRISICLLLITLAAFAEKVSFKTEDGVAIVGTFTPGAKNAPTVVCLPMYRSKKESYKSLLAPLVLKGINVLAIDLRGHGESAPELAARVKARDPKLFNEMHLDVKAAIDFLVASKQCDRTRVGLVGASVGCSVAIDYTRRHPGDVRAVVLLTPGSNYLGVNSLEHLKSWPGTSIFTFTSSEEKATSKGVMDALDRFQGSSRMVVPGRSIHGTRMFGQVNQLEELIANYFESSLVKCVDLRPHAGLKLRRGEVSVLATPKAVTVTGGNASISVAGKRSRIKAGEPFAWTWKPGTEVWLEVHPAKGRKLRFPAKGQYALMPTRDDD
ncbi:MAG: alpha/beta hydrolase [Planctomycetota bacterium]